MAEWRNWLRLFWRNGSIVRMATYLLHLWYTNDDDDDDDDDDTF
jgi:hypothetical protein